MGTLVGTKPTQMRTSIAPKRAPKRAGIDTLVPTTETAPAPVVSPEVQAARAKQAAARASLDEHTPFKQLELFGPDQAPIPPKAKTAVQIAQEKQAAAKAGLAALQPETTPPVTFPITPESLAERQRAADRIKAEQAPPAPAEGT